MVKMKKIIDTATKVSVVPIISFFKFQRESVCLDLQSSIIAIELCAPSTQIQLLAADGSGPHDLMSLNCR